MSSGGSNNLCCWTVRNRPVMAYAEGAIEDCLSAIDLFPRTSFKRGLLARAIRLLVFWRIDWRYRSLRNQADPLLPAEDLASLLDGVKDRMGAEEVDWLVTWPARPERQRIYLIVRAREGNRISVVKIGAGEFNRRQLRNEAAILQSLAGSTHPFAVPSVLFEQELTGRRTGLALSGFPGFLRPVSARDAASAGSEMIAHLKQIPVPVSSLCPKDCHWFPAFCDQVPAGAVSRRLLAAQDKPIEVGFAHGDLGPGNMLKTESEGVLLFDWENASTQAPVWTDTVGLWLALRQRRVLRNPVALRDAFQGQWNSVPDSALLAALAFLCAHGTVAAARLLEGWE